MIIIMFIMMMFFFYFWLLAHIWSLPAFEYIENYKKDYLWWWQFWWLWIMMVSIIMMITIMTWMLMSIPTWLKMKIMMTLLSMMRMWQQDQWWKHKRHNGEVYPHLAKSSADSIGLSIRSTVRNAAWKNEFENLLKWGKYGSYIFAWFCLKRGKCSR